MERDPLQCHSFSKYFAFTVVVVAVIVTIVVEYVPVVVTVVVDFI
jgi:hypothetical protein